MYLAAIHLEYFAIGCDRPEPQEEWFMCFLRVHLLCVLFILLTTLFNYTIGEKLLVRVALRLHSSIVQVWYLARCAVVVRDVSFGFRLCHGQVVVGLVMVDKGDVYSVHGSLVF